MYIVLTFSMEILLYILIIQKTNAKFKEYERISKVNYNFLAKEWKFKLSTQSYSP